MNNKLLSNKTAIIIFITGIFTLLLTNCTKKQDNQTQSADNNPAVTTSTVTNITQTSATSGGNVTSDGGSSVTSRGVCWSTSQNPEITGSHSSDGAGTGSFTSPITGLAANTPYFVRAYVTNVKGTVYGNQVSFTTLQEQLPTLTTSGITNITQTTAKAGGNVTSQGSSAVTERGVCWSTSQNPTISNDHLASGAGTGTFTTDIGGLSPATPYYVKAYAKNTAGTAYGDQQSFTTTAIQAPEVVTVQIVQISENFATCDADVTSQGSSAVTDRGVCWSTTSLPTITDNRSYNGQGTGVFTGYVGDLSAGTAYSVRAFATNSYGTSYGAVLTFTTQGTFSCGKQFTDLRDGKNYQSVQIGSKCWMATNLNVGTRVDPSKKQADYNTIEKYCYDNLESNCDIYGGLYPWNWMMNGSYSQGVPGICPSGWHLPTETDWCTMTKTIDPSVDCSANGWDYSGAAYDMKSTTGWNLYNGSNASGFTALPGGHYDLGGFYEGTHTFAYFWTSTCDISGNMAWARRLSDLRPDLYRSQDPVGGANSVRCVQN